MILSVLHSGLITCAPRKTIELRVKLNIVKVVDNLRGFPGISCRWKVFSASKKDRYSHEFNGYHEEYTLSFSRIQQRQICLNRSSWQQHATIGIKVLKMLTLCRWFVPISKYHNLRVQARKFLPWYFASLILKRAFPNLKCQLIWQILAVQLENERRVREKRDTSLSINKKAREKFVKF